MVSPDTLTSGRSSRIHGPIRLISTLIFAACLSACSLLQIPEPAPTLSRAQHEARLRSLQCWELTAKIGIRTYEGAESARVDWEQFNGSYRMNISGALGISVARIQGDATRVVMHTERNRMLVARSPEVLIRNELGWELPVSNLYYWIRGLPVPGREIDAERRAPDGLLLALEQDGWKLEFDQHRAGAGTYLPEKMNLTHPDITVKLIIKEWEPLDCGP